MLIIIMKMIKIFHKKKMNQRKYKKIHLKGIIFSKLKINGMKD